MGNNLSAYHSFWPSVEIGKNLTFGLTEVQNESFEFYWTVKNFSQLEPASIVTSSEFSGGKETKQKWVMHLYPKSKIGEEIWTGIFLRIMNPEKINASFKLSLTLNGSTIEYPSTKSYEFTSDQAMRGWQKFVKYPEKVENDQIIIGCKVTLKNVVSKYQIVDEKYLKLMIPNEKSFEKILSDFGKLWKNPGEQWDLSILVDGRDFKAHKNILSARSPVFSTMLSTHMKETQSSTLRIEDCDPEIVESMIEYIYTGKTKIGQNVLELFYISEKYELSDLKAECEVELVKNLNFENSLELFDLGDQFNAPLLKSLSLEFILQNYEEISKYPGFKENLKNNNQLSFEILNAVLLNKEKTKS